MAARFISVKYCNLFSTNDGVSSHVGSQISLVNPLGKYRQQLIADLRNTTHDCMGMFEDMNGDFMVETSDFLKWRHPQNGWFIVEIPLKFDDLGLALFQDTSIYQSIAGCIIILISDIHILTIPPSRSSHVFHLQQHSAVGSARTGIWREWSDFMPLFLNGIEVVEWLG